MDGREALITNMFNEIRLREASLATNRKCSVLIELALRRAPLDTVIGVVDRSLPYLCFMAVDRYASHVAQTGLALLLRVFQGDKSRSALDSRTAPRTEAALLRAYTVAVEGAFWDLLADDCGAHVLRALLSVLLGLQADTEAIATGSLQRGQLDSLPEALAGASAGGASQSQQQRAVKRRGASAKRQRTADTASTVGPVHAEDRVELADVPIKWLTAACEWAESLVGADPEELRAAAQRQPACGFMTHALVAFARAARAIQHRARKLTRAATAVSDDSSSEADALAAIAARLHAAVGSVTLRFLGVADAAPAGDSETADLGVSTSLEVLERLCTDRLASRVAEAALRASREPVLRMVTDRVFVDTTTTTTTTSSTASQPRAGTTATLVPSTNRAILRRLVTHPIGNFLVQQMLACISDAGARLGAVRAVLPSLGLALARGFDGVLWQLAETLIKPVGSDAADGVTAAVAALQLDLIHVLVESLPSFGGPATTAPAARLALWIMDADKWRTRTGRGTSGAAAPSSSRGGEARDSGASAADADADADDDDDDNAQAAIPGSTRRAPARGMSVSPSAVRFLRASLSFAAAPRRRILDSVSSLSGEALVSLARSPWGSRHLLEPIFESSAEDLAWCHSRLVHSLRGHWLALAEDRFGCWVASKAFASGDVRRKERIAEELFPAMRALEGSPWGRQLVAAAKLEHFAGHKQSWRDSFTKSERRRSVLKSVLAEAEAVSKAANLAEARLEADSTTPTPTSSNKPPTAPALPTPEVAKPPPPPSKAERSATKPDTSVVAAAAVAAPPRPTASNALELLMVGIEPSSTGRASKRERARRNDEADDTDAVGASAGDGDDEDTAAAAQQFLFGKPRSKRAK